MSLFDKLFKNRPKEPKDKYTEFFRLLNAYRPVFTSYSGSIYESELIRAAIGVIATHISKLKVEISGAAKPALRTKLEHGPNEFQTWTQFMYRLATILYVHNSAFITPIYDEYGQISGIYSPLPDRTEIVQYRDVPYLRYHFSGGDTAALELENCGIMTRFQYRDDLLGETNRALLPTMDLIKIQNDGIKEGVKSAATYRFMARYSDISFDDDLAKERKRFTAENFGSDAEARWLLLFPSTYNDIKQIDVKPWVVDAEQMKQIEKSVFYYFGINEDVLTSSAYGDKWTAFYESVIEPFSIQFSEVVTKMLYTFREQSQGNRVMATANRLQYLSNKEKLEVSSQLVDRGILSINDARDIWNLAPVEGGDERVIRGEYVNTADKIEEVNKDEDNSTEN